MKRQCVVSLRETKYRKLFIILSLVAIGYFWWNGFFENPDFVYINKNTHAKCIIPKINPFDKEIMKHYWKPNPIVCSKETDLVYIDDMEMIHVNFSRLHGKSVNCSYQPIVRQIENDKQVSFGNPVWFNKTEKLHSDFFRVQCFTGDSMIHDRLHYHIIRSNKNIPTDSDRLSVLIFGLDSMSRLAAIRELPKTMKYLQETLNAHILKGYTIVGGNSLPNLASFLTGKKAYTEEFPVIKGLFLDNHPFIWKQFKKRGAVTMYAEDFPQFSTLNYGGCTGFNQTPVDHYLRPFYLGIDQMHSYHSTINTALMFLENKNIQLSKSSTLCYNDEPRHVLQINYFKRFLKTYKKKYKFAMSWLNEIGHEYTNFIKLADDDFLNFFTFLKDDGHLEDSVLFFVSDHGSRTGTLRNSPIGRVEVRLPFFSVVLPESLKQKYPHIEYNLKNNENRLTTGFDFHETIKDILYNRFSPADNEYKDPTSRGISLFKSIPEDRSCADAHIGEEFCACYTSENVSTNHATVKKMANFAVSYMNNLLHGQRSFCAKLSLKTIVEAKLFHSQLKFNRVHNRKSLLHFILNPKDDRTERYLLVFYVKPSSGMFEAMVEHKGEGQYTVLGDILRTNRYGNQSECISENKLKPYCYCKKQAL